MNETYPPFPTYPPQLATKYNILEYDVENMLLTSYFENSSNWYFSIHSPLKVYYKLKFKAVIEYDSRTRGQLK